MIPHLDTDLAAWIAAARPGERIVVHTAPHMATLPSDLSRAISRARSAGQITTAQRRHPQIRPLFELIVIRTAGRTLTPPLSSRAIKPDTDSRQHIIRTMRLAGVTCAEIAEHLNVSETTIFHHVQRMKREGLIE